MGTFDLSIPSHIPYLEPILWFCPFMFSVCVHEVAHGWVAYKLGDPTAKQAGRLTLNPIAHIDPIGSIMLPLVNLFIGGPLVGFAKPVPINLRNLKDQKRDEVLIAFAGPLSNLVQAAIAAILVRILMVSPISDQAFSFMFSMILQPYMTINISLMAFNMLPIPPLDGSSLIMIFVPKTPKAMKIRSYIDGISLLALFVCMGFFPGWIGSYLNYVLHIFYGLFFG